MMMIVGFVLTVGTVALLLIRRSERFALSSGSIAVVAAYVVVALLQGAVTGSVRLDDDFVAVVYVALPVWAGVFGGIIEGFAVPVLASGPVIAIALLYGHGEIGAGSDVAQAVAQGAIAAVVLSLIGIGAGLLRRWPVASAGAVGVWPLFPLMVHFDSLRGYSPWITTIGAAALALAGFVAIALLREFVWPRFRHGAELSAG